ncbi:MAG: response regulator [Gammaproteobacteria bacterium]|nr:response regulator [Gammaproteobacteria bacterium]
MDQHKQTDKLIYYIEDNPANLRLMEQLINRWTSFKFLSASEPVAGIEEIKQHSPDIILLDINLPNISGYEVLQHLRENNICPDAPVFAVTANAMETDTQKIKDAGFDEYISKPVDIETLIEKLNNAIE